VDLAVCGASTGCESVCRVVEAVVSWTRWTCESKRRNACLSLYTHRVVAYEDRTALCRSEPDMLCPDRAIATGHFVLNGKMAGSRILRRDAS
jgi:hypothetical protein